MNIMNIEQIPSDELVTMTDFWHRAFNTKGCDPGCHCCGKALAIGSTFKLATVDRLAEGQTREVMLCDTCTVEGYNGKIAAKRLEPRPISQGCFRVNGKIVK
jgi:hypothetical protein